MNTFLISVTAMLIVTVALLKIGKVRYVYIVPEGYAGLLHHKGQFVETFGAGRHVRWGRFFSTCRQVKDVMLGLPGGFVPLKNGKAGSPAPNTEEGGAT